MSCAEVPNRWPKTPSATVPHCPETRKITKSGERFTSVWHSVQMPLTSVQIEKHIAAAHGTTHAQDWRVREIRRVTRMNSLSFNAGGARQPRSTCETFMNSKTRKKL